MLLERIIFLGQRINEEVGNELIATLLYLDNSKGTSIYINSSEGEVVPCLTIFDTISYLKKDISTTGFGDCNGMTGLLLTMGGKKKRQALRNARIMLYHPTSLARGQAVEVHREAYNSMSTKNYINEIVSKKSDQPIEKIAYDLQRKLRTTAAEALEYGLIDSIVRPNRE
jgi:ATP-dependent Clp protease protease subunit